MGLDFLKQYGAKRYVSDADVYRQMHGALNEDLARHKKERNQLAFLLNFIARTPLQYEREFTMEITEVARHLAVKLVRAARAIEKCEKAINETNENLRLKLVKGKSDV
jgi:hypothetical protein